MRKALFVVNPTGTRHPGRLRMHCREAALSYGWTARFVLTRTGDHTAAVRSQMADYLATPGDKVVFAMGGDGTVRGCAHELAGSGVPMAIVPRGTANLLAGALGISSGLDDALRTGFEGADRFVDVAYADGQTFVAMAGIGIDGAVVESTPHWLKQHLGWLGYAVASLPHLVGPTHELTLRLDGAELVVRHAQAVVVGNVGTLPGGFALIPGACLDDGLLDVGVLDPKNLLGWLSMARRVVAGAHSASPPVEHYRAQVVEVSAAVELPRQLDGDILGHSASLSVWVGHKALLVRVPGSDGGGR